MLGQEEEEEIQVDRDSGGAEPLTISEDGEKDAPRQEAQEEEDPASKESASEGKGRRHSGRSHKEQKKPGTGNEPRPGCSHWQGQSPARGGLTTHPPGPATDPIQAPPNTLREGREGDPGTTYIEIEEEKQPPGETAQEQGKEEMHGNSAGEVLEGLRRKLEEEKNQEERHTLKLWKKIRERERSFSEGIGGLDWPTYMELLVQHEGYRRERKGVVLGLEAAINLMELAEEEQDQQAPTPQSSPQPGRRKNPRRPEVRRNPQKPPKYRRWRGFARRP